MQPMCPRPIFPLIREEASQVPSLFSGFLPIRTARKKGERREKFTEMVRIATMQPICPSPLSPNFERRRPENPLSSPNLPPSQIIFFRKKMSGLGAVGGSKIALYKSVLLSEMNNKQGGVHAPPPHRILRLC